MKFLLIGANFLNKGAEAMALVAVEQLANRFPGCSVTVASYAKNEARPYGMNRIELGGDSKAREFELIPNRAKRSQALKVMLLWMLPFGWLRKSLTAGGSNVFLQRFAGADAILDLSGFALSDKRPLYRRLAFCLELATARAWRKPFYIMTQALGPFDRHSTKGLAKFFLPMARMVIARDDVTLGWLRDLGIDKRTRVERCADSAYLFHASNTPATPESDGRPRFGIVPNINIHQRAAKSAEPGSCVAFLARLCDFVWESCEARPVFVCHERYEGREDDLWLAQQAIAKARFGAEARLVPSGSAAALKAEIGGLDFVAASRFHAVVAAISQGTPVVALGWAHKYRELLREAGLPELALESGAQSTDETLGVIQAAWSRRETIGAKLKAAGPELRASAARAYDILEDAIISEKSAGRV